MTHYIPQQRVRNILRRMVRRPWHTRGGTILDWNDRPVAKVIDDEGSEAKLIALAPELALAYVELAKECEELRDENDRLADQLEEVTGEQKEIA